MSASLYLQSGIKYILTQGDSLLIAWLATLEDQGMYALSANYGGLIARMLFRPIEDSSRNLFAKLCASPTDTGEDANGSASKEKVNVSKSSTDQAATILRDILRIYSLASLVAFAVGPTAAPLLLRLVAGAKWSDTGAGEVLATYCYYIPLLATNGVSEAFVAATASTKELRTQSLWMGFFFVGFGASAYLFVHVLGMGARGLVLANCVNMALRIVFNLSFVASFFRRHGVVCSGLRQGMHGFTDSRIGFPYRGAVAERSRHCCHGRHGQPAVANRGHAATVWSSWGARVRRRCRCRLCSDSVSVSGSTEHVRPIC